MLIGPEVFTTFTYTPVYELQFHTWLLWLAPNARVLEHTMLLDYI